MTTFAGHFLGPDTHANRPSATGLPEGTQYYCTTHSKVEHIVSAAWADYYSTGGTETLPVTILDAKGDVIAATAADTAARLAVGTDGQVLTAASGQSTGLQWATPSGGGAWTLLHTVTLGSAGTFDQSGISGSYNDLIIVLIYRSTDAGADETPIVRFNNDSGANYYYEYIQGTGTTATVVESLANSSFRLPRIPAASGVANSFGMSEIIINGYASTTWHKTARFQHFGSVSNSTGVQYLVSGGCRWASTAAITRIQSQGNATANFVTGSQLRIYGRL